MKSGDVIDFCNWVKLRQVKRLGHLGTNRESILKYADPKGNSSVLNISQEELMDYADFKTIGDAGVQKNMEIVSFA